MPSDRWGLAGFWHQGLESCGGRCVFSSEVNPWARKIYARNFGDSSLVCDAAVAVVASGEDNGPGTQPTAEVLGGCIQSIDAAAVPYHDILTAGFPCQPFTAKTKSTGLQTKPSAVKSMDVEDHVKEQQQQQEEEGGEEAGAVQGHDAPRPRGFRVSLPFPSWNRFHVD
jgi:site-specific DNA-cytosine methylase